VGACTARTVQVTATMVSSATRVYILVSVPYQLRKGLVAARAAAATAAGRPKRIAAQRKATGMMINEMISGSMWVATTEDPNNRIHTWSRKYHRGGEPSRRRRDGIWLNGCEEIPTLIPSSTQKARPRLGTRRTAASTTRPSTTHRS
jgi:hypothetical protein